MTDCLKNRRGVVGILTTLVITIALLMIAVTVVLNGISSRTNALNNQLSQAVFIPVEGCVENALLLLSRDVSYSGGSYTIDSVPCTVSVTGTGDNRDITVSGTKDPITRDLFLRVQLNPSFAIIDWSD